MKTLISFVMILGIAGSLGCGEAKKEGKAEVMKAAEAEADKGKAAVEDRTAKPKETEEMLREGKEIPRERRPEGR